MDEPGDSDGECVVRDLTSARAGDKGQEVNVAVVADDGDAFNHLASVLIEDRVTNAFDPLINGDVVRYELPQTRAFNFVITGRIDADVTTTLRRTHTASRYRTSCWDRNPPERGFHGRR